MNEITQDTTFPEMEHLISRSEELTEFVSHLPINEFTLYTNRIFNLWGEREVGKTTFVEALRDSDFMGRKKVVWITPKYQNSIDTPQEFIAACSQGVRFPSAPQREESLAKKLEESQKGKVDPIRSDDSLLITRSTIATNKQPYVNAAAAASVGRTSFIKDDMEVSVGLGNNRAGNQAEAFLDALPLQSMGADLVILHFRDPTTLSGSVRDWFRDYVIPAATKGPYRRNLVVVEESSEPFKLQPLEHSWGEWDEFVVDFELHPTSVAAVISFAQRKRLSQEDARFVFVDSLGYPAAVSQSIGRLSSPSRDAAQKESAQQLLAGLTEADRVRLAICSLPETIRIDEFDTIVGQGGSQTTVDWLASLPGLPLQFSADRQSLSLPMEYRIAAISSISESPEFRSAEKRWLPYARLLRNVADPSDRSKLFYVAGLEWIDSDRHEALFTSRVDQVSEFVNTDTRYFSRQKRFTHVSQRIQGDLFETASHLGHEGIRIIRTRALALWEERRNYLNNRIEDLDKSLKVVQERLQVLQTKHSQVSVLLKRFQSNGTPVPTSPEKGLEKGKNGLYIGLLAGLACILVIIGLNQDQPISAIAFLGTFAALISSVLLVPGWKVQRAAKESVRRSKIKNSPEYLIKENADIIRKIQENETAFDDLSRELAIAKEELKYTYV